MWKKDHEYLEKNERLQIMDIRKFEKLTKLGKNITLAYCIQMNDNQR